MIKIQNKIPIFISLIIMIVAQMGTNFYLVSLPKVALYFNVDYSLVLDTIYFYLIPYGVCQLFIAPFVNRLGFKNIALIGFLIFSIGALTIIFSHNIFYFSLGRTIQGFGGSMIYVLIRMLIQQSYKPDETNIAFSIVESFAIATPAIAPIVGAYLLNFISWKGLFVIILAYCIFATIFILKFLKNEKIRPAPKFKTITRGYFALLKNWSYFRFLIAILGICMPTFFCLATVPFILSEKFYLKPLHYSLLMSFCILGSFFGSLTSKFANERGLKNRLIRFANLLLFIDGIALLSSYLFGFFSLKIFVFCAFAVFFCYGAIFPNLMADSFREVNGRTGLEIALLGFFQVSGSAIFNFCITRIFAKPEDALPTIFIFASFIVFFAYKIPKQSLKKDPLWNSLNFLKKRLT